MFVGSAWVPPVASGYDANGNRASMTDGAGSVAYTYDALDRLTRVARGADAFSYVYDKASNVTSRTYPDGVAATYVFSAEQRLTSVTSSGAKTAYLRDRAGNVTQVTFPNKWLEKRVYDRAGRLTAVQTVKGTTVLSNFVSTLDAVGNPTAVVNGPETTTYDYDLLDRLVEVCYQASCPGGSDPLVRWSYDAVGNRLGEVSPAGVTGYAYDADDRLLSVSGPAGSAVYAHDANGRVPSDESRSYVWDGAGRLASATAGGQTTAYSYDGDGTRLTASAGGQKTRFLWDVNAGLPLLALERDGAGALLRRYLEGTDTISVTSSAGKLYYHRDGLGSITGVTSAAGVAQWRYRYEPFGGSREETRLVTGAPDNPLRFAGEYRDPTGLDHLRARQYDPATGRFLSTDPLAPAATDPYVSAYAYVDNRPTALVDPSGMAGGEPDCGPLISFSCGVGWFVKDQIGWRDGCERSTRCLLTVEFNIAALTPWGRGARAAKGGAAVVRGGESAAAAYGRAIHRTYNYGPGFRREFPLPSGRRADAVNLRTREVIELKPNNPAAIRRGQRQVDAYARELERTYPGAPFRTRVETYDRP